MAIFIFQPSTLRQQGWVPTSGTFTNRTEVLDGHQAAWIVKPQANVILEHDIDIIVFVRRSRIGEKLTVSGQYFGSGHTKLTRLRAISIERWA
jgi:hypothetical protein